MADYNQRCADVFGSLSLPQGSSLRQASSLKPEEGYLSSSDSREELVGQSVSDAPSMADPRLGGGRDFSNGQEVATGHSSYQRRSPEGSNEGRRRYAGDGDEREDVYGGATVRGGGRRGSPVQGRRGDSEGRYKGRSGKRHQGRGHRATPDHIVHPQHWTKYDLNEDRASDSVRGMSEEQRNTFAAQQFLDDLRARNRRGQGKNEDRRDEEEPSGGAVVFRKPAVPTAPKMMDDEREAVKGTWNHARVLPEYQVGLKPARKRKPISASLTCYEEEDDKLYSHGDNLDGMELHHLGDKSGEDEEEWSCDGHMTIGKDPKQSVGGVESLCDSLESNQPPKPECLHLPSTSEGEEQGGKVLFKKPGKRKKQGQRKTVVDEEIN